MKRLVAFCVLAALTLTACRSPSDGQEAVESSEKWSEPVSAGESWELGENWYYGPQAISGDLLVAVEMETEDYRVVTQYLSTYNLRTREKTRVLEVPADRIFEPPAIDGDRVVWASLDRKEAEQQPPPRNQGILNWDVFLLDLSTGEVRQLTTDEHAQVHPAVSGDTIVWLDRRHGIGEQYPYPYDVYAYDLRTSEEKRLTLDTTAEGYDRVSISGALVVWTDMRHADPEVASHPSNAREYDNEIYVYDLGTGRETRVTVNPANDHHPAVDGDRIVWLRQHDYREADVFAYDVAIGLETQVSRSRYADHRPDVFRDRIVWTDARASKGNTNNDVIEIDASTGERREPAADIYLYDMETQQEVKLTSPSNVGFSLWMNPCMSNGFIVYGLDRQVGPIVYAMKLADE
jgi:beta propeller repeat protein